jgi:hypothetical protein
MEAYRESSATAPFILNLSGVQHHASGALNLGKNTAPVVRKLGGHKSWSGNFAQ